MLFTLDNISQLPFCSQLFVDRSEQAGDVLV
jgi:hypothetical protein